MSVRIAIPMLLLGAALGAGGCRSSIDMRCEHVSDHALRQPQLGMFARLPQKRIGCLPFPGPLSLYAVAPPGELGDHSYSGSRTPGCDPEVGRGILYTRRAGFIDICHLRLAADLAAYVRPRIRHALVHHWPCFQLRGEEPSLYHVQIHYPPWWYDMGGLARLALVDELSIRLSQHLALTMVTWHEILTWFGFRSTVIFSERGSAFTYEEATSHILGVLIAGDALRSGEPYDEATTRALHEWIQALQPVERETLDEVTDTLAGDWWETFSVRRRHLDVGLDDGVVEPWLAPGVEPVDGQGAVVFHMPTLHDVDGWDCTQMMQVTIDPRVLENWRIFRALPARETPVIDAAADLPRLLNHIEASYGADVTGMPLAAAQTAPTTEK